MILNSKVSSDGGGGGGPFITRPSLREKLYRANIVLFVDHEKGVMIEKNRYGQTGKPTTDELVDILCHILADHAYDGRMKIFQAGLKKFLKRAVKNVLKKGIYL